jgi:hypothetical protein
MKIIMDPKSGYSEWTFDKKEIQAINKHGKLICEPQFIRHFSNVLIKLVTDITVNLDEETRKIITKPKTGNRPDSEY